jgi:hypothetical protein
MRARAGDANVRALELPLPPALRFDSAGLREICARREALKGHCPEAASVGTDLAETPLVEERLTGPVFVVQPRGNGQPDLWASLAGEGLRLTLQGRTLVEDGRIETRFDDLPDMPLSLLKMQLQGGRHGVLSLDRGLCGIRAPGLTAPVSLEGQNRAYRAERIPVATPGFCRRH